MKVVAFNGSPRKDGNTAILIREVFSSLEKEGIETELIQFAGRTISGCRACYTCAQTRNCKCSINNDLVNESIGKIMEADGVIIGSPTYFSSVSAETKAFIDRIGVVCRANGYIFKRKVGAAVVAGRRGGMVHTFDTINHLFFATQMIVAGSNYWNMGMGKQIGEVNDDEEGIGTMQMLGENMAWLLKKVGGDE